MVTLDLVPESAVPEVTGGVTAVFATGYEEVICVPPAASGFVTLQERVTVQLLAPAAIVQGFKEEERVPDIVPGGVVPEVEMVYGQ